MQLYNTMTKQKEQFKPITPGEIKMYVCGQTVYDYCHMGHARKSVTFDMIRQWFIASGYKVTFVENITDIDDKIIKRANENNETINQLTERFIQIMHKDFAKLGITPADIEPRATNYINEMLEIIEDLVNKGYAYLASNGDVYYRVRKFAGYGKLSGKSLEELNVGQRIEIDTNKEDPLDFVLWKSSKANEPFWESKFGKGRPGWHIECSAMSEQLLGKHFDIHGGGQDLQFPHHENEIAQSEAHNGCTFANYWMHNGFLNINEEKMSKSLGNFFTVRDVLKQYKPEVVRFFMLRTHYRSPLNFTNEILNDAKLALNKLYIALSKYDLSKSDKQAINWEDANAYKFKQAMDDDFNTPLAISVLFELANQINKNDNLKQAQLLKDLGQTLGILQQEPDAFLKDGADFAIEQIEQLIEERNIARSNKDFTKSDQIRAQLLQQGIILEDVAGQTKWRRT